jgi:hypothetical protein
VTRTARTSSRATTCRSVTRSRSTSKSTDRGATWSAPALDFIGGNRTAEGYPVANPDKTTLTAPSTTGPIEDVFPAVAVSANGRVYLGAYRGTFVSPWQTCAAGPAPPVGRIECDSLGNYINNTRLDYVVADLTTGFTNPATTHPINSQYGFGGGFFGDYTDIAAGSDDVFHALWTDTNNVQSLVWFYGFEFVPTSIHQQDIVTAAGSF